MDFNDIKIRLVRTLDSLNGRFNEDIEKNITIQSTKDGNSKIFSATFGNESEAAIINRIFLILYNLASLKDHLKTCLEKNGYDKNIVEKEVNNSLYLQVLIDLVNQEKHGYPLTRTNRSGKNPIIDKPSQFLGLTPELGLPGTFFAIGIDKAYTFSGQSTIIIDAEIWDDTGNFLFRLDELVNICYLKWITIANTYNCSDESLEEFTAKKVNSPAVFMQYMSVETIETTQSYKIKVLKGSVSYTEYFYEIIENRYVLVDPNGPIRVLYGNVYRSNEEIGRDFNELLDSLMNDTVKIAIDDYSKSDDFHLGVHTLKSQGDLILENGMMKVIDVNSNGPFKIVEKITMKIEFKVDVSKA